MNWYKPLKKAQQEDARMFAPGEDPSKFGTPNVDIVGDTPMLVMRIPGVEGSINLNVSIAAVKQALERVFGGSYFFPITTIKVAPLAGAFGETFSNQPHTLFVNESAMIEAVSKAVRNEAASASSKGIEAKFTPEIGKKIEQEIAKLLWETIPHEREHALDFQKELHKILETGQGSMASVPESHGEQAGKSALSRFKWYIPR